MKQFLFQHIDNSISYKLQENIKLSKSYEK